MEYDFSIPTDRRGTDSYKWDSAPEADIIPLWVADMDFETFPAITEALQRRVAHGIFGYTRVPEAYYEAVCRWFKKRHGWHINREDIIYTSGVVPAVSAVIKALTLPGDQVIVQGPVYNCFFSSIRNNGCEMVSNSLIYNKEELRYEIDFDDLERKLKHERARLMLLCNPHNPVGRVWREEELRDLLDVCRRNGVYVIADEIHHDLIMPGHRQITAATAGDYDSILITLTSASKTFNLASCQNAMAIIPNDALRAKYDAMTRRIKTQSGSSFGYVAYEAAFRGGKEWLEQAIRLIYGNYQILVKGLKQKLPEAVVSPLEGTYLAWVDLSAYLSERDTERTIRDVCNLAVDFGEWFGRNKYENFIRVNLATSPDNVRQIVARLDRINTL